MTRYREKTRRTIISELENEGSLTVSQLSTRLGKENRVIRNYLHHYREDFEVKGQTANANLWGLRAH